MNKNTAILIPAVLVLIIITALISQSPIPLVFILLLFSSVLSFINRSEQNEDIAGPYDFGSETAQRRAALRQAQIFLNPYKDIWRDLRLSNKYCSITLGHDGVTIKCVEKVSPYRRMQITKTPVHTPQELWNMFCIYFSHNKSYDGVMEDCDRYHASTIETTGNIKLTAGEKPAENKYDEVKASQKAPDVEKLDVNNCSEIELTELPGISIVLAKKIIKRREQIRGFNSVNDFFNFLKLKPHMENQLRDRVKIEKMKGSLYQKKYDERSVDF